MIDDTGRAEAGAGGRCCGIHDQDVADARFLHASSPGEGAVGPCIHMCGCSTLGAHDVSLGKYEYSIVVTKKTEWLLLSVLVRRRRVFLGRDGREMWWGGVGWGGTYWFLETVVRLVRPVRAC